MTYSDRLSRFQVVVGVVGFVAAAIGYFQARNLDFSEARGAGIGWPSYQLALMTYNRLGAIVALVLAAIGLIAGLTRRPALGWIAAGGFSIIVVQGMIQTRPEGDNVFGSAGQTISFSLALALAFAVTALLSRYATLVDDT